jgi:uncharacterized membrane protein HdeD (DUF308 family)
MSNSRFIAGLIGPLLMAVAASMLLNSNMFPAMVEQLAQNYAIVFVTGMISLVAGLAVVRVHNVWEADWRVIVTIFGWLAVIGGVARMILPDQAAAMAQGFARSGLIPFCAVLPLALGAFLTFKGYQTET